MHGSARQGGRPPQLAPRLNDVLDDRLLCEVVRHCEPDLARHGFRLDDWAVTGDRIWVQFRRAARDRRGQPGTQMLLIVHGRRELVLLVDEYFIDAELGLHTPQRKALERYQAEEPLPAVAERAARVLRDCLS